MHKIISWIAGGVGGLLLLYSLIMVVVGEVVVRQNHTAFFQEKLQTGLTIAYNVGVCGSLLVVVALALWLVARMHAAKNGLASRSVL